MITGNNRAHFIPRGMSARRFFRAPRRGDHKLIRRKNKLSRHTAARSAGRLVKQPLAPSPFGLARRSRTQDTDDVPVLRRSDQCCLLAFLQVDLENARTPEVAFVVVTA